MTPMQEQYNQIKLNYKDFIVLFRLGDFYEAFNNDAVLLSKVLGITLTARGKDENKTPMAGIPYHALSTYMPKIIDAKLKLVIADQVTEAVPGKLVERKVTKIITPGTVMDESSLDPSKNNYISCIYKDKNLQKYFLAYCDLTTGFLEVFEYNNIATLKIEHEKLSVSEVLTQESEVFNLSNILNVKVEAVIDSKFNLSSCLDILLNQFRVLSLKGFGINDSDLKIIPAGVLINYLQTCQNAQLKHLHQIKVANNNSVMNLDIQTIKNLEILYSTNGDSEFSLYTVLNKAATSMGKRLLRKWLLYPLINKNDLENRLNAVEYFYNNPILLWDLKKQFINLTDLERLSSKIGVESCLPRDLISLNNSLKICLDSINCLNKNKNLPNIVNDFLLKYKTESNSVINIKKIIDLVESSIALNPPASLSEVGFIKDGFSKEIDDLRSIRKNSKQLLLQIQEKEIKNTGINSLKVSYNQVFGFYIEVTKNNVSKVPNYYFRKQTLANAERYITQELKEVEEKILSAEEKLLQLEQSIFKQIQNEVSNLIFEVLELSFIIAQLDCLINFAQVAKENNYIKPVLNSEFNLIIENSRHPVVEKHVKEFIPNSVSFKSDSIIHILTGPNMSGKSTYIRQIALLSLMAQAGSFVPATKFEFSLIDRIFTRVGASDNLAKGESTFMVEMVETANILNNATKNSLVILDEVGRGTSTYDGVAIAWSVVQYIANDIGCKTLFATHYHELIALENKFSNVKNYNVQVTEVNNSIEFNHKIIKGGTNKSYGVHVAKLAGIPEKVTSNALTILKTFEQTTLNNKVKSKKSINKLNIDELLLID